MKPSTIEFSFDDAKLEAINIYLQSKSTDLEKELGEFMDALYKKHVPPAVREFIDKKETEDAKITPPQRSTRKKANIERNAVSGEENDVDTNTRPIEEKSV